MWKYLATGEARERREIYQPTTKPPHFNLPAYEDPCSGHAGIFSVAPHARGTPLSSTTHLYHDTPTEYVISFNYFIETIPVVEERGKGRERRAREKKSSFPSPCSSARRFLTTNESHEDNTHIQDIQERIAPRHTRHRIHSSARTRCFVLSSSDPVPTGLVDRTSSVLDKKTNRFPRYGGIQLPGTPT